MDLVHDIDLVSELGGREVDLVAQVADVVNAAIAGRVNLDQVEGAALINRDTAVADVVRFAVGWGKTVHRLGKYAGGARLAGASRPAEQVGMRQPAGGYGVSQGIGHGVLTDYLFEGARTPFSVKDFCHCPSSSEGDI